MTDYRREWVAERACAYLGMDSTDIFNDMFQFGDEDMEDQFLTFIEDDLTLADSDKRCMFVYRTPYERLIEKEILVPEIGKFSYRFRFITKQEILTFSKKTIISRTSTGSCRER